MGQGLGRTQRAMLRALEGPGELTIVELMEVVGLSSMQQTRETAHALEARGLVFIEKATLGWKGQGRYGPLVKRSWIEFGQQYGYYEWIDLAAVPTVMVKAGEPWPGSMDAATERSIVAPGVLVREGGTGMRCGPPPRVCRRPRRKSTSARWHAGGPR